MSDINDIYRATYSCEDNKLRIYADAWLDADEYKPIKDHGFHSAPKQAAHEGVQGLFFAAWSPSREDLCIKLAGSIELEGTTLAERAEIRAERFAGYQANRVADSNSYHGAASRISERFANGQPILLGHHSQRSAERDQKRMHTAMDNAIKATETANYWSYRIAGVEHHANRKANPAVRARRIKKLLTELRDVQRGINQSHKNLALWQRLDSQRDHEKFAETVSMFAGGHDTCPWEIMHNGEKISPWSDLRDGKISAGEIVDACLRVYEWSVNNPHALRWVAHLLGRLGYERSELGEVARFEGELTPVILQTFAREQGADKPKARKGDTGYYLDSKVPFPLHMGEGETLFRTDDEWRVIMQACGHTVIIKEKRAGKKQTCSLVNPTPEEAEKLQALWNADSSKDSHGKYAKGPSTIHPMPQSYYSARSKGDYSSLSTITLDQYGRRIWTSWRGKDESLIDTCRIRIGRGNESYGADRVIVVTDKPQKALPTFEAKPVKEEAAA